MQLPGSSQYRLNPYHESGFFLTQAEAIMANCIKNQNHLVMYDGDNKQNLEINCPLTTADGLISTSFCEQ